MKDNYGAKNSPRKSEIKRYEMSQKRLPQRNKVVLQSITNNLENDYEEEQVIAPKENNFSTIKKFRRQS
jgi:hypothetical protein